MKVRAGLEGREHNISRGVAGCGEFDAAPGIQDLPEHRSGLPSWRGEDRSDLTSGQRDSAAGQPRNYVVHARDDRRRVGILAETGNPFRTAASICL
jgi:hypothetical protein